MSRLLVLLSSLGLCACNPFTFTTEIKGESVVPGSLLGGTLGIFPTLGGLTDLNFDQNRDFQNEKVTRDHVTNVTVESVTFKILSPSDQDFTFLDTVQLVARAGDIEATFAEKLNIADLKLPPPNPVLTFDIKAGDLTQFVTAPSMSVVLRGKGRQPAKDTRIEAKLKLRVSYKL